MELVPIQSDSGCPSPDAVQAEVRELTTTEQRQAVPAGARVVVTDRGESIAIAITRDGKTNVRVYEDAARDCERRSHFVSVLVVVSLMPPDLRSEAGAPTTSQTEPLTAPPVSGDAALEPQVAPEHEAQTETKTARETGSAPRRVRIELGGRAELSTPISDSVRAVSSGAGLGVALGARNLRLTLAIGYMPAVEVQYTGEAPGHATLERLDAAIGARWVVLLAPLAASLDAAAVGMRAEVSGESSSRPRRDTAFSAGARLGLHLGLAEQSLVSPFLGVNASVFPSAPALSQLPQGTVGHLPYVWLGLNGGLALAL